MPIYDAGALLQRVLTKRRWKGAGRSSAALGVYCGDCDSLGLDPKEQTGIDEAERTRARLANDVVRARRQLIENIRPSSVQVFMNWSRLETDAGVYTWARTDSMMEWLKTLGYSVWVMFGYPPRRWTARWADATVNSMLAWRTCLKAGQGGHVDGSMAALRAVLTLAMTRYGSQNRRLTWGWEEEMDHVDLYGSRVAERAHTNAHPPAIYDHYRELQRQFKDAHDAARINDWLALSPVTADTYGPDWGTDMRWVEYLRHNGTLALVTAIPVNCYGFEERWTGTTPGEWYSSKMPGRAEHYHVITSDPPIVNKLKFVREQTRDPASGAYPDLMQVMNIGWSSFCDMNYRVRLLWKRPGASSYELVPATHLSHNGQPRAFPAGYKNGVDPAAPNQQENVYVGQPLDFDSAESPRPMVAGTPLVIDPDRFAAVFAPKIRFDAAGTYWFKLELNGRAKLYVDGQDIFNFTLWNKPGEKNNVGEAAVTIAAAPVEKHCNIHYYHVLDHVERRQAAGDWLVRNYAHLLASRFQGKTAFRLCTVFNLDGFIVAGNNFGLLSRLMQTNDVYAAGTDVEDQLARVVQLCERASFDPPFDPDRVQVKPRGSVGGYRFTLGPGSYLFIYWGADGRPIVERTASPT